jgi:putative molybdopterin biosynthesis protein
VHIELNYNLGGQRFGDTLIRNALMDLLQAVRQHGSISAAARELKFSYRHVWGELKRWEAVLGHPLIVWEKGQSARLSEFGDKLLWAERQAQARLSPQIEALLADLERTFAVAFDDSAHVLTFYASHDDALVRLREFAQHSGKLHLDIRFCGSVDAIRALNEGRCLMAGFHTMDPVQPHDQAKKTYRPLLKPGLHKIIGFAQRTQGLMLGKGNPLQIFSLRDMAERKARFVNRALGSGTRVILDDLLVNNHINPQQVLGYDLAEPSHTAVAQCVASGQADVGLGIEAVARARDLDFVPLIHEHYHLVCLKSALELPAVVALRALLGNAAWHTSLQAIAGYEPSHCGQVLSLRSVLPWWDFASPKDAI